MFSQNKYKDTLHRTKIGVTDSLYQLVTYWYNIKQNSYKIFFFSTELPTHSQSSNLFLKSKHSYNQTNYQLGHTHKI